MVECDSPWPRTDRHRKQEMGVCRWTGLLQARGEKRLLQLREATGDRLRWDQRYISAVFLPRGKKIRHAFSYLCRLLNKFMSPFFQAVAGFWQGLGNANLSVIWRERPPEENILEVVAGITTIL